MDLSKKKILFIDLDDTLIETVSGDVFPRDITDFKFKLEVLDKIRTMNLSRVCIVTNQGGIPEYVAEEDFKAKLKAIEFFMFLYCGVPVSSVYCASRDPENDMRKPNTGMLKESVKGLPKSLRREEVMLMVGDASGKEGDHSDSDKRAAENFHIDYLDVSDFVNL